MRQPITGPVAKEKVQLIQSLMADPEVNRLWFEYIKLPAPEHSGDRIIPVRLKAFHEYAVARDKFLGFPLLSTLPQRK